MARFSDQLRGNSLAIISLLTALAALGYNTWRNEQTEYNRNTRQAGFEMLVHISELQRVIYLAHFDRDGVAGNPNKGWTKVLILQDLAVLMPAPVPDQAALLQDSWAAHWSHLGSDDERGVAAIDHAINDLRTAIVANLESLD